MCWSIGPNSPGTRIINRSHAITDLKRVPSLTSLYAIDPGSSSSTVSDAISSSVGAITENSESMLSPLRIALKQILEKETSLYTLDKSSTSNLVQSLLSMIDTFDSMIHSLKAAVVDDFPTDAINTIVLTSIESAKTYATSIDETLLSSPVVGPVLTSIQNAVAMIIPIIGQELASLPPSVGLLASFTISYTIISTVQSMGKGPPLSSPYPLGRYDSSSARIYFRSRLGEMAARASEIGARSGEFGLALLGDAIRLEYCLEIEILCP